MNVLLDFDSIMFPLLTAMSRQPGGDRISYDDMPSWDALVDRSGGVDEMLELFDRAMTYEAMRDVGLFDGAADGVRRLHAAGARFHLGTDRKPEFVDAAARLLAEHAVPLESVNRLKSGEKVQYCAQRDIRVVIDDHPVVITDAVANGVAAVTLAYQYNREERVRFGVASARNWGGLEVLIARAVAHAYGQAVAA